MAREINLVPDVKAEMIKTLKQRNFAFFICIIVAIASVAITILFGVIVGGQKLVIDSKKSSLDSLSAKLGSYGELNDYLTIKDQLGNLSTLANNQNVLSRTFDILSAMLPQGPDTITISQLNVDLSAERPTFTFEAQADAGQEPFIDYNVLDSFKKSMEYLRYDYGQYVDKDGNTIPAYCMIETSPEGSILQDPERGIYAYWTINAKGCNTSADGSTEGYQKESYQDQEVVRIWRTPQFSTWYHSATAENQPFMNLDGTITGVEHFDSACVSYKGNTVIDPNEPKWEQTNDQCLLVPDGIQGIKIADSSNGRDSNNSLVLRFSAGIELSPEVFKFPNTHMLALAPSGRHNVTDSYVQIQAMFGQRATDCKEGDTGCKTNTSPQPEQPTEQNVNSGEEK